VASRADILNAVVAADRLHREFDTEARAERGEGRIDVFGMLVKRNIPVLFRPLTKLLGAFVNDPDMDKGVIVTTRPPLRSQRFTAAHELGHAELGHKTSYDGEEILTRALFVSGAGFDPREVQANAFATELLTPPWLIVHHMERQRWERKDLSHPINVYQLALRMGSSYSAMCYALAESGGIDTATREKLLGIKPKTIKQALVKPYEPESWYGDVWLVTERDNGMVLDGSRSDLVVLKFQEHASSGYVWQFGDLADAGLEIVEDGRAAKASRQHIGGVVFRTVIAESQEEQGASGHVHLQEVRPWQVKGKPLNSLELDVEFSGPVRAGLLPAQQEAELAVA
jgi:Zn-dependent peptidase ImmA (M78 family)/predicted secreted protein